MTRSEKPTDVTPATDDLAAESRERAVGALLKIPPLRKLWGAQLTGAVGDRLGLLVLLVLTVQAAVAAGEFGGGYRGAALTVAAVFAVRLLAVLLFGAVLLGPLSTLTGKQEKLNPRGTMVGADAVRLVLLVIAPLWSTWVPGTAVIWLMVTVFVAGAAERVWAVAKDGAAPGLVPDPAPGAGTVRPVPDHLGSLRRLDLRTSFVALPIAAVGLIAATLVSNLLSLLVDWFGDHQVAFASYTAAGLFASSVTVLYTLELPDGATGGTARPRSPLEGLRRPGGEPGRTGALRLFVLAVAVVAAAVAAAVSLAVLFAFDLGSGPIEYGLLTLALTAGPTAGIRLAPRVLPALSRRRLFALAIAMTGLALLLAGLVPDPTTVLMLLLLAGTAAGISANVGHTLIDQEAEEPRRARITEHLHAVVRVFLALGCVAAPVIAGAIGPHRMANGSFTFDHGGAAFTLMLVGALLLPVAAIVLGKTDDRSGVPLRRDLREALRGGDPAQAPAATGFFIAVEGGDGAGKSTQVEALAEWIRGKGHDVVVTREPGATAVGKRLRSILLDVSGGGLSHRAEALLYAADRAEHVDTVLRPALARGAVVISDRYIDSSVAYQGAGRDLAPTEIARISRWATDGLVPHLTVLLDVSPQTARERFTEAPDRLESEPEEFHQRVRSGFLTLAAADPARYLVIDAAQEPEAVTTVVRHRLDQLLPLSQQEIDALAEARRKAAEEARRRTEEEAARKAEEERLERERREQLERLRKQEQERKRLAEEAARREAEERAAEQAQRRAEEARRQAEKERRRREAEERALAEEQERLRRQKAEQDRLRREAEGRRLEKQRKDEKALLRAEEARRAAAAAADIAPTVETPLPDAPDSDPDSEVTRTMEAPVPPKHGPAARPDDETAVLPAVQPDASADAETTVIPQVQPPAWPGDETAVLPPVPPDASRNDDETAVLPSVTDSPGDGLPPDFFRTKDAADRDSGQGTGPTRADQGSGPEPGRTSEEERTREFRPGGGPEQAAPSDAPRPRRRPRPSWAEETPLDDLPSLADELLGPHEDEDRHR
jgi:dTMP kinase